MADFRKMLFVLAGLMILIGTASAQTGVTCTAFVANQPLMRQEGTTEPAGDIIIQCSGALVGAQTGSQTLSLYVNGAAITSRQTVASTTGLTSIPTEATLLVNDNVSNATVNGASAPVQGLLQNGALVFSGFTLPNNAAPNTFQVRVTNVRVNANSLAASSFVTGTVLATFPIQNQQNLVLGAIQSSLSVAVSSVSSFAQCNSTPTQGTPVATLTIKELVNTAFKAPAVCGNTAPLCNGNSNTVPGQWYQNGVNSESQTVINPSPAGFTNTLNATIGQADSATRIRINFSNIPAGVTLSLPVSVASGTTGSLVATTSGDVGAFSQAGGAISLTSSGSVTYEVRTQNGAAIDSFNVPVTILYTYTPPSTPNVGSILVSATYAPTTAEVTTLNPTFGIPRFADTSVLTPIFTIAACQTDLLFTFMSNQGGFDTGFSIANTSSDPFGTPAQNGTCTLNWYGAGPAAGTATTTPSVASGTEYHNLVSNIAPAFQGYMIAQCNFQFGHGFAFLRDGYGQPGSGLSQGYLASIIPTPGLTTSSVCGTAAVRCAADASKSSTGQGEALNQ